MLSKNKRKRLVPKGWKKINLGKEFKTSSGATPLSSEKRFYENGTIPWINSGELASPYIYESSNYITQEGFDNSSTTMYPPNTVLVAMYGATAGKASLLKIEACTNQAICAIFPNDNYCSQFIKYSIDNLYDHLVGISSGSARDNLSQAELKDLELIVPQTRKEQEVLASTLSLLDKKIELNRQINDNLEAMAKQLYDYWFVQFDFPNEEGKPYKSSGGAMVW
uniref:restriction endonuclease subunit S n=1 Tax=Alloprevotella sp. TaxID=1872471 RepID=UPI003FEFC94A